LEGAVKALLTNRGGEGSGAFPKWEKKAFLDAHREGGGVLKKGRGVSEILFGKRTALGRRERKTNGQRRRRGLCRTTRKRLLKRVYPGEKKKGITGRRGTFFEREGRQGGSIKGKENAQFSVRG